MSKILKIVGGLFGLVGLFMMFLPQVVVHLSTGQESLGIAALLGGTYPKAGTGFEGVGSGLAGYILIGVGGLLLVLCALLKFFQEHDVVNYITVGLAIICLIVGIIMIFLIRKGFADVNGFNNDEIYVGVGAMIGGSLGALGIAFGGFGLILDFAK